MNPVELGVPRSTWSAVGLTVMDAPCRASRLLRSMSAAVMGDAEEAAAPSVSPSITINCVWERFYQVFIKI